MTTQLKPDADDICRSLRDFQRATVDYAYRRLYLDGDRVDRFLVADEPPMECPRLDHFGMSVATEAELDDMLARAREYRGRDERVEIVERNIEDHGVLAITSFYVRYLLPLMVEVQWWDMKERDSAATGSGNVAIGNRARKSIGQCSRRAAKRRFLITRMASACDSSP